MIFEVDIKHVPTIVEEQVVVDPGEPPVTGEAGPRRVLICTDWWTDIDDGVAMRCAAWAERVGMIDVVALTLSASDYFSAPSLDEMWSNDGVNGMLIGKGRFVDHGGDPSYQGNMIKEFVERDYSTTGECESALRVMRRALVDSEKNTEIITIGFLTNVSDLLQSGPDDISPLTGMELVTEKCPHIWVVGGKYPNPGGGLPEYNFRGDPAATKYVCENSPVQLTFLGYNEGYFVKTGQTLNYDDGAGNPIPRYSDDILSQAMVDHGTWENGNNSWDPLMMMVMAHGDPYRYGYKVEYGYNSIEADGRNEFTVTGNPEDDRHMLVNRYETGTLNSDKEMWERDMNPILEKYGWPDVRADLGNERLAKLPKEEGIDFANLVFDINMSRFHEYPDETPVYQVSDSGPLDNHMVRRITPEAPVKGNTSGSTTLKFEGLTSPKRIITKDSLQISNESTMYVRVLFPSDPTAIESILTQSTNADSAWRISAGLHWQGGMVLGVYRWPGYGNTGGTGITQAITIVPNQWHTIAVRFIDIGGDNYIEAFWDGTQIASVLYGGNYTPSMPIGLGNKVVDGGDSEQFYGHISHARVYSGAHDDVTIASVLSEIATS